MSKRKLMDISELYDELRKLSGAYALCVDIVDLARINTDYGYAAGDIVIAEAFARVERELSEQMLLFRTGGDEFAVVTALESADEAQALARKITTSNGVKVKAGENEIPLSLRVGISQIPTETLSYKKALAILEDSVNQAREARDFIAVYAENTK